jgi:hypothetical protein
MNHKHYAIIVFLSAFAVMGGCANLQNPFVSTPTQPGSQLSSVDSTHAKEWIAACNALSMAELQLVQMREAGKISDANWAEIKLITNDTAPLCESQPTNLSIGNAISQVLSETANLNQKGNMK